MVSSLLSSQGGSSTGGAVSDMSSNLSSSDSSTNSCVMSTEGSLPWTWQIFSQISSQPAFSWKLRAKSKLSPSDQTMSVSCCFWYAVSGCIFDSNKREPGQGKTWKPNKVMRQHAKVTHEIQRIGLLPSDSARTRRETPLSLSTYEDVTCPVPRSSHCLSALRAYSLTRLRVSVMSRMRPATYFFGSKKSRQPGGQKRVTGNG